ncbi:hypothetical protein HPE56_01165 [Maribacter sp. ANRC-HE7]|uniref:Uncharacterized protein n=1 Tax=Maribacter aquimaris TaxID=2737171 RepID=A0ABR7UY97_9FLAO|nr:hypothetical protein [Maribacter aquimaris]MBD0776386.1 hypothetical protein [Maribacter aquimaris]
MEKKAKSKDRPKNGPVVRVRLVFKNQKYHLIKSKAIEKMGLLKSIELPKSEKIIGNYIELTDAKGNVLYRNNYEDVSDPYVSIPNENGTSTMIKSNLKERHLEILVPNIHSADTLRLYSSGNENNKCEEVFRLTMKEIKDSIEPKNRKK